MTQKDVYSIKISDINSDWANYRIWKNNKDVDPDDLTLEEIKIIADELHDYHLIFMERLNRLTY